MYEVTFNCTYTVCSFQNVKKFDFSECEGKQTKNKKLLDIAWNGQNIDLNCLFLLHFLTKYFSTSYLGKYSGKYGVICQKYAGK